MEKYFAPEKVFLFFVIFIGLFMVLFIPPFQSQDEPNHFKRAYSVSALKIFSVKNNVLLGNNLPCAIQSFINAASDTGKEVVYAQSGYKYSFKEFKKLLNFELDKTKQCFLNYPNMAIYSPFAYLPQSIGILFASFFSSKILFIFLAARSFNLLFFTLLCFYAIKTTPYLKWVFALVLSCPMCIALASSLSADAVLISCCALFFAKILEIVNSENYIKTKDIFLLVILSVIIAMTKQSFWFLLFIFLIPKDKLQKKYFSVLSFVLVLSFIFYFLWSMYASSIMVPLNDSDMSSHVSYILSHPASFILLVAKTVFNTDVIYQSIGVLGWKSLYFNNIYYLAFVVVLLANLFCGENCPRKIRDKEHSAEQKLTKCQFLPEEDVNEFLECHLEKVSSGGSKVRGDNCDTRLNKKPNLLVWQKMLCLFVIIFNVLLICATTFCFWTYKNTFNYIELQGRYLLPFALPFLLFMSGFVSDSFKRCPRKIRDKKQSDVNEFLECHLEKVSSGGSKVRGDNCDTRLNRFVVLNVLFLVFSGLYVSALIFKTYFCL